MALIPPDPAARIVAVLGPTNTGKTHLAVERMLGHRTGVIGLPLRLLAREIYDRVSTLRGASSVALVTGEEKIVPAHPAYFVCTTESMPLDRSFDFLAVDEIQLAADPERGHVFTHRLLRARGSAETMLLGADTIRPLLRRLIPEAEHISRPRFSTLAYSGAKKISRLPPRSAVVAFSAADVYALAELVRRQLGGAAVVLGALSPRARNAQVSMYQAGEVDYLVATDAIGMGLNMDVDHVAFAALAKFDGRRRRPLSAAELGQIAGRAGRHMNDGTFGATAQLGPLDEDIIQRVENHCFETVGALMWRNSRLSYDSLAALLKSLDEPPPWEGLVRARDADDQLALKALGAQADIAALATGRAAVRLLWEVCQIPDYRKTMAEAHARLLGQIYRHLMGGGAVLPTDWVARHVARLERVDGDIDTLAQRIAHIRTWTYVSHRPGWIEDARHWQERARGIEDRLSDALHAGLTQRFVDRRTAVLVRRMRETGHLLAAVDAEGSVVVEGEFVGRLFGLGFVPDPSATSRGGRTLRAAARRALRPEIAARVARLKSSSDDATSLSADGRLWWDGAPLARLSAGDDVLRPRVELPPNDLLTAPLREQVRRRLEVWLERHVACSLAPLIELREASLSGAARGLAFQLMEALGLLPRRQAEAQVRALTPGDRRRLRRLGVRFGPTSVFLPALQSRRSAALGSTLWAVHNGVRDAPPAPDEPSVAVAPELGQGFYAAAGFRVYGGRAVRPEVVERLAAAARRLARAGPFLATRELISMLGGGRDDLAAALTDLGYSSEGEGVEMVFSPGAWPRRATKGKARRGRRRAGQGLKFRPDSPFARLRELKPRAR